MALLSDLGVVGQGTLGMIYQPKLKNRFSVIFYPPEEVYTSLGEVVTDIAASISPAVALGKGVYDLYREHFASPTTSLQQALTANAVKCTIPEISFETINLHRYNSNIKISQSKYTIGDISITFENDITNNVAKALQTLLTFQHGVISQSSLPYVRTAATAREYKFPMDILLLDGSDGIVEVWNCHGCFFKSLNYGELGYESGDQQTVDCNISVDLVTQTFDKQIKGQAIGGNNTRTLTSAQDNF